MIAPAYRWAGRPTRPPVAFASRVFAMMAAAEALDWPAGVTRIEVITEREPDGSWTVTAYDAGNPVYLVPAFT